MDEDEAAAIRRRDTTKGLPLRILSLDGGGVRGYSTFIILQDLMHRTFVEIEGRAPKRHEIPKPCDHFDLIFGTGTGGLIAIMLGRLRLDLETCKEVYTRMTRKVFETDKMIAGIPYSTTLFKASKLEEAIKECVREHSILVREGNDGEEHDMHNSVSSPISTTSQHIPQRHLSNASVTSFSARSPSSYQSRPMMGLKWGNPNALLYDNRENRTKTAVTAVYKNSTKSSSPAILRSYDSRKEPSPEFDCKIWEAGRATCAAGLAFKPIQIGQSVFIDEGAGQFNPAPYVLEEACVNEWPGRDVGVFVSIGTGKRPSGSDSTQHLWYEGFMGDFAEARRRLIAKIEGCEETHKYMVREGLSKRGVNIENYYRLNVEVGVGEFGMNEWHRLAEISTNTRQYLAKPDVKRKTEGASHKLGRIHRAARRSAARESMLSNQSEYLHLADVPEAYPTAIELPAEVPISIPPPVQPSRSPPPRPSYESGHHEALEVQPSPRERSRASSASADMNGDRFTVQSPTPEQYQKNSSGMDKIVITSRDEQQRPRPVQVSSRIEPPPLPPKTPIPGQARPKPTAPYPLDDGPPVINMARKPDYRGW